MPANTEEECKTFPELLNFYELNSIEFKVENFLKDTALFAQVITSRNDIVYFETNYGSFTEDFYKILSRHPKKKQLIDTLNLTDEFLNLLRKVTNHCDWIYAYLANENLKRHVSSFDELWNFFDRLDEIDKNLKEYFLQDPFDPELKVIRRLLSEFTISLENPEQTKFYKEIYQYIVEQKHYSWTIIFIKSNTHNLHDASFQQIFLDSIEYNALKLTPADLLFFAIKLDKKLLFTCIANVSETLEKDPRSLVYSYTFQNIVYLLKICKETPSVLYKFLLGLKIEVKLGDELSDSIEQCLNVLPDDKELNHVIMDLLIDRYGKTNKGGNFNLLCKSLTPIGKRKLVEYQLTRARNFSDIIAIAPELHQGFETILFEKNESFIEAYNELKNYYGVLKSSNFDPKQLQYQPRANISTWCDGINDSILIKLAQVNQLVAIIGHNMYLIPKLQYASPIFLYQENVNEPAIFTSVQYSFLLSYAFPDFKSVISYLDFHLSHQLTDHILSLILKPEQFKRLITNIDSLYTLLAYFPEKKQLIIETYVKLHNFAELTEETVIKLQELYQYLPEAHCIVGQMIPGSKKFIRPQLTIEENFDHLFKNNDQNNMFVSTHHFFEVIERFPYYKDELITIMLSHPDSLYEQIITSVAQLARLVNYFPHHNKVIFDSLTELGKKRVVTLITGLKEILLIRRLFPHHALSLAWYIIKDPISNALIPNPNLRYISLHPISLTGHFNLPDESINNEEAVQLAYYHDHQVENFFKENYRAHQFKHAHEVMDRKFLSLIPNDINDMQSRLLTLSNLASEDREVELQDEEEFEFPLWPIFDRLLGYSDDKSAFKKEKIGLLTGKGITDRESTLLHYLFLFHIIYLDNSNQTFLNLKTTFLSEYDKEDYTLKYFKYKQQCMDVISRQSIKQLLTSFIKQYEPLRSALFDWLFVYKDGQIFKEWTAPINGNLSRFYYQDLQALYDCFYRQKSEIDQILATILPISRCLEIGINLSGNISKDISKKILAYYQNVVNITLGDYYQQCIQSCPVIIPINLALFSHHYSLLDLKLLLNDYPYIAFYPFSNFVNLFMREENKGFFDTQQMFNLHKVAESGLARFIKQDYFTIGQFSSGLQCFSSTNVSPENLVLHYTRIISLTIEILKVEINFKLKDENDDTFFAILLDNFGEEIAPIITLYKNKGVVSELHREKLELLRQNITREDQLEWLSTLEKPIDQSTENIDSTGEVKLALAGSSHSFFNQLNIANGDNTDLCQGVKKLTLK